MPKARYALGVALLVAAFLYLLPTLQAANKPVPDSPAVSNLLAQAKTRAIQLRNDADLMHKFALSNLAWESHAAQISTIKDHVNNLGKTLQELSNARHVGSPWQQDAIDRITPLAREMASNIESTIKYINNNQSRVHMPEFRDLLSANYDVSSQLAELIGDYVAYGKSKAKYERLGASLEIPSH